GDLQSYLKHRRQRPLSDFSLLSITLQLCEALGYLHSVGLIHRDVKSSNVFLQRIYDQEARQRLGKFLVVLGDLGEARVLSNSSSVASSMVGSPAYWSPELCVGAKYHRAADVWALGIVLYESAT
ncbi:kinase-like domain-containing protein, partial [Catenaria anguillulae PL171]